MCPLPSPAAMASLTGGGSGASGTWVNVTVEHDARSAGAGLTKLPYVGVLGGDSLALLPSPPAPPPSPSAPPLLPPPVFIEGGTMTISGGYRRHVFSDVGSHTVTVNGDVVLKDAILVGGGAGSFSYKVNP